MKRNLGVVLLVTLVMSAILAAILKRPVKAVEPETTPTSTTTEKPDDRYKAVPRTTEAANYGDGNVADLCELMKNITGTRVRPSFAKVEDFFSCGFEKSSMGYHISYEEYKKGEKIYSYYNYMQASKEELSFNKFIFTANEEFGNLYMVEFINSNDKAEIDLKPSSFSKAEMIDYYTGLEKELTKCFGNPTSSKPLDKEKQLSAFYEYKINEEITFRLEFDSFRGTDEVSLKCTNSVERKHFLIHEDNDVPFEEFEKDNYYKPVGDGDIVTDKETGFQYVKNQLLVSFKLGTPNDMEKMNGICKELGAKVVGYLKTTSDFQIEFDHDVSCKELLKTAEELKEKYYFIEGANLNFAIKTSDDDYLD